ncbi:NAD(P)/FAD-dependent oxidoreductase [Promethearchaeum syntrophicum]|uniref:NAD(P)/FAD-dependent oxidoreductase n=1 Tax=Promethearchaeum syntrophicum TaxID=2594042 RepID=A0A5B9DE20_9ARCH|nr:FAD-dependent oxidoreductase [Candidatus Prometheoarchaeum syntrophicum]
METTMKKFDLIIIGAGPAGLTAAIYSARAGLSTLVIDQSTHGGQVATTHSVANYPGFDEPITGYELATKMKKQAERFGTKFELAVEITDFSFSKEIKWVELDEDERFSSNYILIATGASPRLLNLRGEVENKGNGISYCATCDGEFYKDMDIFVIGGGNSAIEESLLLLRYVKSLTIIHQFDVLQAEKITADKVLSNPKVKVLWSHEPRSFKNTGESIIVEIENLKTKETISMERDGVFIFVGMVPNSKFLLNRPVEFNQNEYGYLITNEHMETSVKGVYAAGDIREKLYWQIVTATSDGAVAALEIIKKIS